MQGSLGYCKSFNAQSLFQASICLTQTYYYGKDLCLKLDNQSYPYI